LGRGFGNIGPQFTQYGFGPPSQPKVRTGNPRRSIAELRQHKASHLVDHGLPRRQVRKPATVSIFCKLSSPQLRGCDRLWDQGCGNRFDDKQLYAL